MHPTSNPVTSISAAPAQSARLSGQSAGAILAGFRHMLLLACAALLLAACSAVTTGYKNAPTLLTWWADRYFDLDHDQEAQVKERIAALRVWHRTQLPGYNQMLADAQSRMHRTVTPQDIAWLFAQGEERYRALIAQAAGPAAELAAGLRPDNLAALEKKLAKNNADFEEDYILSTPEKRHEKRYERMLEQAERWYGSFSREQKEKIRELAAQVPENYPLVLEDRRRRQAEVLAILRAAVEKKVPQEETARQLKTWAGEFERGRSPAYRDFGLRYRAGLHQMFAAIANLATPQQRQVAEKNVQRYMHDFTQLALATD